MEISASSQCVSARLFALVPSKRTRGNRCKLKHGRVHLNVNFFVFFFLLWGWPSTGNCILFFKGTVGKARRFCSNCGNWAGSTLEGTYEGKMGTPQKQLELVTKEGKLIATFKICWNTQGKNDDLLYMRYCRVMLPDELIKPWPN